MIPHESVSQYTGDFTVQVGYNLINNVKGHSSYGGSSSLPSLFLEYHLFPLSSLENLGVGLGAGFSYSTTDNSNVGWAWTYDTFEKGEFFYWPLYLSVIYKIKVSPDFTPYFKTDHGFNFHEVSGNVLIPDDRFSDNWYGGGYYMSLGAGVLVSQWISIEASFSLLHSYIGSDYQYSGYWSTWQEDYTVSVLNISAGLTF